MKLDGLKINFLGDSITEGAGVSCLDKVFWKRLCENASLFEARGYGVSGTRIAKQKTPSAEARWDRDFCQRYIEMDDDADVVVVFGGTNDFGHGDAPLGQPEDRTPYSFYGACHTLFAGLVNKYPDSTVVVMTPLHRITEDNIRGDGNKKDNLAPLSEYVRIIKEVAAEYSLPLLDLWSVSSIQPKLEANRVRYCPDGLHPNDRGHEIIAQRLEGFLRSL